MELIFNHDGFNLLDVLSHTPCMPADADRILVRPLAERGFTAIDWNIVTTGYHNCRTRHRRLLTRELLESMHAGNPAMWNVHAQRTFTIGDTIERYARQEKDLLEVILDAAQHRGMKVFGCVRLNHANAPLQLDGIPGRSNGELRKDFSDEAFHTYLVEL
jgi:hypothetical protein